MRDRDIILPIILGASVLFSASNIYNGNKIDPQALESFKNSVSASFDDAEKSIINTPDNNPVVKCDCNGSKIITHGDGHQTPCPCTASGECKCAKKESNLSAEAYRHAEIVMYTRSGCLACEIWKNVELPKVEKAGWKVQQLDALSGMVPRFDVFINNQMTSHNGYMTMQVLKDIVDGQK